MSSHYLVVDVAALQFVGPSTWMYNFTPNILTLLFLINCVAMGRARFLIYPWFIYFFLTARPWAERGS